MGLGQTVDQDLWKKNYGHQQIVDLILWKQKMGSGQIVDQDMQGKSWL